MSYFKLFASLGGGFAAALMVTAPMAQAATTLKVGTGLIKNHDQIVVYFDHFHNPINKAKGSIALRYLGGPEITPRKQLGPAVKRGILDILVCCFSAFDDERNLTGLPGHGLCFTRQHHRWRIHDDQPVRIPGCHFMHDLFHSFAGEQFGRLSVFPSSRQYQNVVQVSADQDFVNRSLLVFEDIDQAVANVLVVFRDQVLFLKHNLNARAIASLEGTVVSIESDVEALISDMRSAIDEANAFVATLDG